MALSRLQYGVQAQQQVANDVTAKGYVVSSMAAPGKRGHDLIFTSSAGTVYTIEVKRTSSKHHAWILLFEKSIQYNEASQMDQFAWMLNNHTINAAIQTYRITDETIGFPFQSGPPKSGRFPKNIVTNEPDLDRIRGAYVDKMTSARNNYLAIVSPHNIHYFHIFGDNVLRAAPLPALTASKLATYGTPSLTSIRAALKGKITVNG